MSNEESLTWDVSLLEEPVWEADVVSSVGGLCLQQYVHPGHSHPQSHIQEHVSLWPRPHTWTTQDTHQTETLGRKMVCVRAFVLSCIGRKRDRKREWCSVLLTCSLVALVTSEEQPRSPPFQEESGWPLRHTHIMATQAYYDITLRSDRIMMQFQIHKLWHHYDRIMALQQRTSWHFKLWHHWQNIHDYSTEVTALIVTKPWEKI